MKQVELNPQQKQVFKKVQEFITDRSCKVFILKGYGGTGKTTLVKSMIAHFSQQGIAHSLLATTGRASKILANMTGTSASTVHSKIYRYKGLNQDLEELDKKLSQPVSEKTGQLCLQFDLAVPDESPDRIIIVDEASMMADILNTGDSFALFGGGKLLADLFAYAPNGKFIFVGDPCQLPPVTQDFSPALNLEYIKSNYNLGVKEAELTQIMRQSDDNDIVAAAQRVRKIFMHYELQKWAFFPLKGFKNISLHESLPGLILHYIGSIKKNGFNYSTIICPSNRKCNEITQIVRQSLDLHSEKLLVGDLLMITQNNSPTGLMNGDMVVVESIGKRFQRVGISFVEVGVQELFTKKIFNSLLIEDVLYSNETNLTERQHQGLMIDFYRRMKLKGINQKHPLFEENMRRDEALNALRAVYGYALTCHKAQGGEWEEVYLYLDNKIQGFKRPYVFQWLYTAITRAKKQLHVCNDWFIK